MFVILRTVTEQGLFIEIIGAERIATVLEEYIGVDSAGLLRRGILVRADFNRMVNILACLLLGGQVDYSPGWNRLQLLLVTIGSFDICISVQVYCKVGIVGSCIVRCLQFRCFGDLKCVSKAVHTIEFLLIVCKFFFGHLGTMAG